MCGHLKQSSGFCMRTSWSQRCCGPQRTSSNLLEAEHAQRKRWSKPRSLLTLALLYTLIHSIFPMQKLLEEFCKVYGVRHQAKVQPRLVVKVSPETHVNAFVAGRTAWW